MQAFFKLSNDILDCGLTPNELKVAVCLYSCVFGNRYVVQVKQSTIAHKCGIKSIATVSNIICKLQRKGIIERVSRPLRKMNRPPKQSCTPFRGSFCVINTVNSLLYLDYNTLRIKNQANLRKTVRKSP